MGIGINSQGDIVIGGNEIHAGVNRFVLVRYNAAGGEETTWRYPLPPGYISSKLIGIDLKRDGTAKFYGQVSKNLGYVDSAVLIGSSNFSGQPITQSIYAAALGWRTFPKDRVGFVGGFVFTGQAGLSEFNHPLLVNGY